MRTTIRLPDDIVIEATSIAARTGRTLDDVVEEAVRESSRAVASAHKDRGHRSRRRSAMAVSVPVWISMALRRCSTSWTGRSADPA